MNGTEVGTQEIHYVLLIVMNVMCYNTKSKYTLKSSNTSNDKLDMITKHIHIPLPRMIKLLFY